MADVTSTARLVVTVEGEDKIKKLAASLKALAGAGGTKKIGVGGGATGLASQMATTHIAVRRAIAPAIAAQVVTAKVMEKAAGQQASVAKTVATMSAAQAVTGKLMGQIGAGQSVLAKTVAPLQAGQAAAANIAKAITKAPADLASGMAVAQKALAAVKARKPEVFGEQKAGPSGITDKFIASLRKRGALGTDDEIRARYANPPAGAYPLNKKEHAQRAAMGLAPAAGAAGLAEGGAGAGAGGLGTLGRVGLGVGVVGVLGGAAVALGALAAAAAAVSVGAWAANKGLDAASKSAKNIWDNMGRAKAAGKTVDQIQDRDALRDVLFGDKAEGFENRLPKLLTDQKRKKEILGDKGIFGKLGLDRKTMAEMEKKGEADATGVLSRISDKRAELEEKIEAAKKPKQKAALEQKLRDFDKSMNLFMGKPLADAVRGLPKGAAKAFAADLKAVSNSFDKITPKASPKQLEQQAADLKRQEFRAQQIAQKRDEAIGRITTPAATRFETAKNDINAALSPAFAQITGNLGRLALDAGTAILKALPTDAIKAKAGEVGKYLEDLKLEDIPGEISKGLTAAKDKIFEAFSLENMKAGAQSAIDNQKALWSDLGSAVGDALTGLLNKVRAIIGLKPIETEAERKAREAAEPVKFKKPEIEPEPTPQKRIDETFGALPPVPDTSAADRIREAFEALPQKATDAGASFGTAAEAGITTASTSGGNAFSTAAQSGLSTAGTQAGGAFNSAINASSIGNAIGAAAASVISGATVNVNIPGAAAGGARGAKPSTGGDTPGGD